MDDVIIIGGGFAGLAAALQLGRAGRKVTVLDTGLPRNRFDTPVGIALKVDERRQTGMPGIYAAGDLATPSLPSVTQATWQGAMAGIFAQQSMLT